MTNKIKTVIIGAGNMARNHLNVLADIDDVKVTGIFSRTRHKAEQLAQEFEIDQVCSSVAELYKRTNAELVINTVSAEAIAEVCRECIKFNWMILAEKPFGIDYEESLELTKLLGENNSKIYIGFNRRFYSTTLKLMADLEWAGDSQRIIYIFDQQSMSAARKHGHPEIVVNNFMYANSIHLLDYISLLARGDLKNINHFMPWDGEGTSAVGASIEYTSGDRVIYNALWERPGPWTISVSTKYKRFELRPLEQLNIQTEKSREVEIISLDDVDNKYKPGLYRQDMAVIKALKGEINPLLVDINESIKVMKITNSIYDTKQNEPK